MAQHSDEEWPLFRSTGGLYVPHGGLRGLAKPLPGLHPVLWAMSLVLRNQQICVLKDVFKQKHT